jgi:hypothetical protein
MRKVVNKIFGTMMFAGFILAFGLAGDSEIGIVHDTRTILIRGGLAVVLMFGGYLGLKLNGSDAVY